MSIYVESKTCICCGNIKPLSAFGTYKPTGKPKGKIYHRNKCKECTSEEYRIKHSLNAEYHSERRKKAYYADQERYQEQARERFRNKTRPIYEDFFKKQNGVCAICGNQETATRNGRVKDLALDHCHTTGRYRGLLCQCCNTALGRVKDDISILKNMIRYLEDGEDCSNNG